MWIAVRHLWSKYEAIAQLYLDAAFKLKEALEADAGGDIVSADSYRQYAQA